MTTGAGNLIVLFDGVCNYCNAMVNFAIRNDSNGRLKFSPLQSATGTALRKQYAIPEETDSLVFIENGKAYTYADAALRIAAYLDWPAKSLFALRIFPSFISNPLYKWIAKNRYKWFGKKDACMLPTPAVKRRFLD
ncbi:thiol-disulfide oxidoreductase DCC family protein [Panacibacter sp. DH6]|uniref:Thiol-disulfide oxidoreductase DCC family protein n=1 Tax=Panacibacter microcysteis TaxID=2793269 RepID=A0A931E4A8_9BACT|nr:thiol-disulfide oxidoreductase DCC family protein [Panacibacter microcysteis]MBG9374723.1 thiol-disulfide oxidoreductase DCC family protein [Panacibacter microcysteis]